MLRETLSSSSRNRCRSLRPVPPAVASRPASTANTCAAWRICRHKDGWSASHCGAADSAARRQSVVGRFSPSGSQQLVPARSPAARPVWRRLFIILAWRWADGQGRASAQGRPEAVQVADRWHLMENVSAAFLTGVQQSMPAIRTALGARVIDPKLLTCAERRQHAGWLRREEENARILTLAKQGVAIKEIVRCTGRSRKLVRQVVRGGRADVFRSRMSSLDGFVEDLEGAWLDGCHNGAALWRRLRTKGFAGSLRVVTEWAELLKVPPVEPVELQRRGRADVTRTRWHRVSRVCASHPPHAASRA